MMFRPWSLLLLLVVAASGQASFPPNLVSTPVALDIGARGEFMAVDLLGNVFISNFPGGPKNIVRVAPDGAVVWNHVSFTGDNPPGQLTRSPVDGQVYFPQRPGPVGAPGTTIWRIDSTGGRTAVCMTDVAASGLAVDPQGGYFVSGVGPAGEGVYRVVPAGPAVVAPGVLVHAVAPARRLLLPGDGSLLVETGLDVLRLDLPQGGSVSVYFDGHPAPFGLPLVSGLTRNPFNSYDRGALVSLSFYTNIFTGLGVSYCFDGDLQSASGFELFSEPVTWPFREARAMAAGLNGDLYWYSGVSPSSPGWISLFRIEDVGTATSPGVMATGTAPGTLLLSVSGKTPGALVHVTLAPGHVIIPRAFLPFGVLELDPLSPLTVPLVDGLGIAGPPAGSVIPISLVYTTSIAVPVWVPPSLPVTLQGLVSEATAPNGAFYETAVEFTFLP